VAPFRIARPRFLAYWAVEGLLIALLIYGLAQLTRAMTLTSAPPHEALSIVVASLLFSGILLISQGSNLGEQGDLKREIVLFSVLCVILGLLAYGVLAILLGDYRRMECLLLLEGAVAVPATIAVWRFLSVRFDFLNTRRERVVIVGSGELARQVCRWIHEHHAAEYAVIGFADEDDSRAGTILAMGVRIQTDFEHLARFAPRRADRVIVALDEKRGTLPVRQLMELRLLGLEIEDATTFIERVSGKIAVETMLPSWLIFSEGFKTSALRSLVKRAADLVFAALLLVLSAPLMALTAVLIALDSGFPVLYRQARLGREGVEFNVLKFRSMRRDAERKSGPTWAMRYDPRVTRVGQMIRVLRIDELPQLFNVFKGQMSFVGPRPEREHFVQQLMEKIPYYGLRMTVRPGITGWAQVEYGYGATDEDALEKLKYDLYYIKNNNPLLDLWIVLKTVKVVLMGRGAR
jgi:sugar transferase (PEP-CTERM system associated)